LTIGRQLQVELEISNSLAPGPLEAFERVFRRFATRPTVTDQYRLGWHVRDLRVRRVQLCDAVFWLSSSEQSHAATADRRRSIRRYWLRLRPPVSPDRAGHQYRPTWSGTS